MDVAEKYAKPLSDQFLTLLGRSCTAEQDEHEGLERLTYPATSARGARDPGQSAPNPSVSQSATQLITKDLLGTGIELFK